MIALIMNPVLHCMTTVKTIADNLVEHVQVQGRLVPVRRYWLTDHWEFRFDYKDPTTGKRKAKCSRTIEKARQAASRLTEPVLTPVQAEEARLQAVAEKAIQKVIKELGGQAPQTPPPAPVKETPFGDLASQFLSCKETQLASGELRPASYRDLLTRVSLGTARRHRSYGKVGWQLARENPVELLVAQDQEEAQKYFNIHPTL